MDCDEELASQLDLLMLGYCGSLVLFLEKQEEHEEYSTEFDCGCNEFKGLGKMPPSWGSHNLDGHTTRLLAHWRHWWSITDLILADLYGITIEDVLKTHNKQAFDIGRVSSKMWRDEFRAVVDIRTRLSLEEMGFAGLEYQEAIERYFVKELTYARKNVISGGSGNYWGKKFDEAAFVPVYRPALLDELMERLTRAVSGEDEVWKWETEKWSRTHHVW